MHIKIFTSFNTTDHWCQGPPMTKHYSKFRLLCGPISTCNFSVLCKHILSTPLFVDCYAMCVCLYLLFCVVTKISSTGTCAWSSFGSTWLSLWANHSCRAKHTQSSPPNHHTRKRLDNPLFPNLFCPISRSLKHPFIDTKLEMCP